jgi:histidinol phosphatase-like enzyme
MRSIPTASTGPILRGTPLGFPGPLRRAVFLDRDGTLVEEVPYLHDPAEVALLPGVAGALAALAAAGYARACRCRKPAPGMLQASAGRLGLDLGASYLIGNHPSDVAAALAAGATPLFVTTGRAAGRRPPVGAAAFPSLAAADAVLQGPREPGPPRP